MKKRSALTLIESLISMALLSVLLVSILGAFFISRMSTLRAKHRITAMDIIRGYMETEIKAGYLGGYVDGDSYAMVSSSSAIAVTIDDRGTADASDDLSGTIKPSPYPASIQTIDTVSYKTIGFVAEWNEDVFGTGPAPACSEKAVTYVSEHS